jgi:hypothetical protein
VRRRSTRPAIEAWEIERSGDNVLVKFQDQRWWAVGWVSAQQQLMRRPPRRSNPPARPGGAAKTPPRIELPQGALVFDRPRGIAFGRVNRRTTADVRRTANGQAEIDAVIGRLIVDAWVANPPQGGQR